MVSDMNIITSSAYNDNVILPWPQYQYEPLWAVLGVLDQGQSEEVTEKAKPEKCPLKYTGRKHDNELLAQ